MSTEVADSTGYGSNREMSVIGYAIAALVALLLLPLLPVALAAWLLWRLLADHEGEPPRRSWKRRGRKSNA